MAEVQPATASQADMLETIDMATLEACSAITEPPRKVEQDHHMGAHLVGHFQAWLLLDRTYHFEGLQYYGELHRLL